MQKYRCRACWLLWLMGVQHLTDSSSKCRIQDSSSQVNGRLPSRRQHLRGFRVNNCSSFPPFYPFCSNTSNGSWIGFYCYEYYRFFANSGCGPGLLPLVYLPFQRLDLQRGTYSCSYVNFWNSRSWYWNYIGFFSCWWSCGYRRLPLPQQRQQWLGDRGFVGVAIGAVLGYSSKIQDEPADVVLYNDSLFFQVLVTIHYTLCSLLITPILPVQLPV
jgi:hypothetical protein